MPQADNILSVKNLHISFGGKQQLVAVNNISFQLERGKTLAIVGESGSGKSLTALALMGLLPTAALVSGSMNFTVNERHLSLRDISGKELQQLRGQHIGMVFQEPMSSLNPIMRVGKQLSECIRAHREISKQDAWNLAVEWLGKVQLPDPGKIYDRFPHQLSGGQKQRVMIAMAMCNHPVLLIADEPTTALDVTVQKEIMLLMRHLQQEHHTAMIFITHDLSLASETADDVMVMFRGEVMEYGNTEQVLNAPQNSYTKALLSCRPSPGQKGHRLPVVSDYLDDALPREAAAAMSSVPLQPGEGMLQVHKLCVWFTENRDLMGKPLSYFRAVDDVSFTLHKGEILGLVGESGCGKSTLSKSLVGLLPVHEGQILFGGDDLARLNLAAWRSMRRKIQMIFQDPFASLNPRMTVGDMLREPMRVHRIVDDGQLQKEAERLMDIVQLPANSLTRYPHQFSGGQRQRLGIARALALRPQLLICDESVSALDVSVQAQILNLLKDLQYEFDLSYLFISHDLNVVHYMSDRVMVMQAGKIVESGDAEQVLKQPVNDYTKKLIAAMPRAK